MRCDEFEIRLEEILDERLSPWSDPLLKEHCSQCAACRGRAAAYETMLSGLALCEVPLSNDSHFAEHVLAEVNRPTLLRLARSHPWTFAASALAAAALILIVVSLSLRPWNDGSLPGPANIVHSPPIKQLPAEQPQHSDEPQTLDELARAAGDKYMVLVRQTGESVAEVLELVPDLPGSEQFSTGASTNEASPGWAAEMAQGLEPVTDSTRSAIHSLWLAIPTADEDTRS
jgi:hypothetical protein